MKHSYYYKNTFSRFIEVKGKDSSNFLQGLITNDINKCQNNNKIIYSCLLSPNGKFLADFFIFYHKSSYIIEIDNKYYDTITSKLEMYKLRSEVIFQENKKLISLTISNDSEHCIKNAIIKVKDPRNSNLGIKVYLNKNSLNLKCLSELEELDYNNYREILMENLIPYTPEDLIEGKSLLLENNFQNINSIDWEKGCYVGQEITARMKYRSLLKKKLYVVKLMSGQIKVNDDIIIEGLNIGKVISKTNKYLLCMLKINLLEKIKFEKNEIQVNSEISLKFL